MGKIIESTLVSLDGVIEDPAKWVGDYFDEEFQNGALERLMRTDAMMMGRRNLREPAWNNTVVIQGDAVREASKVKQQTQRRASRLRTRGYFPRLC